ncbi:MAG TPA: AmmeMemoRadiSam system radical SAM enzyme, partial [bacterium]
VCRNCQNAEISQMPKDRNRIQGEAVLPDALVTLALQAGCASISYTYTEPSVFWDYTYDTARLARDKGLKNVFVTNGYFSQESLEAIAPFMDAANVDLKAFRDSTYKENCGARLEPVLETIRRMRALGIWVEVTTLLIPGLNDSDGELKDIADFVFGVDPDMPWHVSRFYPTYRLSDCPPTPPDAVRKARDIGLRAGLRFVYTGNLPGDEGESTVCWNCKKPLVERLGFQVLKNRIIEGKCIQCGTRIAGIWG